MEQLWRFFLHFHYEKIFNLQDLSAKDNLSKVVNLEYVSMFINAEDLSIV